MTTSGVDLEAIRSFIEHSVLKTVAQDTGIAVGYLCRFKTGKAHFERSPQRLNRLKSYVEKAKIENADYISLVSKIPEIRAFVKKRPTTVIGYDTQIPPSTIRWFGEGRTDFRRNPQRLKALFDYMVRHKSEESLNIANKKIRALRRFLERQRLADVSEKTGIPTSSLHHFRKGAVAFQNSPKHLKALYGYMVQVKAHADKPPLQSIIY